MNDEELKAAKAKFKAAKKCMGQKLESERKAIAEAEGNEFQADKVAHEWNVSEDMQNAIRATKGRVKNRLFEKMDAETNAQNKEKGVTRKWQFIDEMKNSLITELQQKRNEVIEQAYSDNIKKFVICFKNMMFFWKELERERNKKDTSFEIQNFNDYDNADIQQFIVEPLKGLLGKTMKRIKKLKRQNPGPDADKVAKEILELYLSLADIVFEADLDTVNTEEFALVCKKLTKMHSDKDPKLQRTRSGRRGTRKLKMSLYEKRFGG